MAWIKKLKSHRFFDITPSNFLIDKSHNQPLSQYSDQGGIPYNQVESLLPNGIEFSEVHNN